MKQNPLKLLSVLLVACLLLSSCGEDGEDGLTSLVNITDEPAGSNCPNGGLRIATGIDANSNGTLEETEETEVQFVCNGSDGQAGVDGSGNKETRINLDLDDGSLFGNDLLVASKVFQFNISNYNADSITMAGIFDPFTDEPLSATIQLYDLTNDMPIQGAIINLNVNSTDTLFLASNNFISNLPQSAIDLGVEIKSNEFPGFGIGSLDLILFKED